MKVINKGILNCIMFSFNGLNYLLPTVAFAEFCAQGEYHLLQDGSVLGTFIWRGLTLPLISPDLSCDGEDFNNVKFAIVNALFSNKSAPPYFVILTESHPVKLKIRANELSWANEANRIAIYSKDLFPTKELVILDLQKLSEDVEKVTSHKSP